MLTVDQIQTLRLDQHEPTPRSVLRGEVIDHNDLGYVQVQTADGGWEQFQVRRQDRALVTEHLIGCEVAVDLSTRRILSVFSHDHCPACGSRDIETCGHDLAEASDAECRACGEYWTTDY